ncbi:hypothetical protein PRIPAC_95370 [Pristionchus pacificus]|nr:hypothetical protein PRIPAC_95370 [Pristionchus pacificus]
MSLPLTILCLAAFSSVFHTVHSCAPTDPITSPTRPPCCRDDIFDNALPGMNGRALFDPVLVRCPMATRFICSVRDDLVKDPTMIILNGNTTIATGPDGTNAFVNLTCRNSDKIWITPDGQVVNKIGCRNNQMAK